MVDLLNQLEELTLRMINRLEKADIDSMIQFVQVRELLITEMKNNGITEEPREIQRQTISRILTYDRMIVDRMKKLRDDSSVKVNKIETARLQKSTYETVYTPASVFFDKKK